VKAVILFVAAGIFGVLILLLLWLSRPGPTIYQSGLGYVHGESRLSSALKTCPTPRWVKLLEAVGVIGVVAGLSLLVAGVVWTTADRDALGPRALTNAALITFSVTLMVWGGATFIAMVAGETASSSTSCCGLGPC